ncbi:MAG: hypothetical protein KDD44_09830, partial [Bdellovibrionales bacterium]|nr:hypothetical protein [Bdellovibrionales bacterium]
KALSIRTVAVSCFVGLSVYIVFAKAYFFFNLNYTHDLLNCTQIATSWLHGQPLFYYANGGEGSYVHNYFILLLLAPLVEFFGPVGLFLALGGFLIVASTSLGRWISLEATTDGRLQRAALASLLLFGPIPFWIYDDYEYGFNAELFYLPIGISFALSLSRRSRFAVLWAALLVLVKESGAVLGCCIFLAHRLGAEQQDTRSMRTVSRAVVRGALPWVGVFALGMLLLLFSSQASASRLDRALNYLSMSGGAFDSWLAIVAMILAAVVMVWTILVFVPRDVARILYFVLVPLPIWIVEMISSFAYDASPQVVYAHGVTWQPRFVVLWAYYASLLLFHYRGRSCPTRGKGTFALILAMSAGLQILFLFAFRSINVAHRFFGPLQGSSSIDQMLTHRDQSLLWCLSDALPRERTVVAAARLSTALYRQHTLSCQDALLQRVAPKIVIFNSHEEHQSSAGWCRRVVEKNSRLRPAGPSDNGLLLMVEPSVAEDVDRCLEPAGTGD